MQVGVGGHDELRGAVRVSVSSEVLHNVLLPSGTAFARAYPNICVEYVEGTGLADLERWEADIAVRTVRPRGGDNLVITRLRESGAHLCAARSLLRSRGIETDAAMEQAASTGWTEWPWVDWMPEHSHLPLAKARAHLFPKARVVVRLSSMETIRLAASAGIGLALIPSYFARISPHLVRLPSNLGPPSSPYLLGHAAVRNTARVHAVWEHLVAVLRGDDDAQLEDGRALLSAAYGVTFDTADDGVTAV